MVLVARCRTAADALWTVEWAADHAAELGADGSAVVLVGEGRGSDLAVAAARYAAVARWPAVDLLALIDPPDGADVRGAHLLDRRGAADVATQLVALLEGANR
jgi:acetyl esterase/lipase